MKKLALFGNPVAHSVSPLMHNYAIKQLNLNAHYQKYLIQIPQSLNKQDQNYEKELSLILKSEFNNLSLDGANITVPFKKAAFLMCDELDDDAKNIGSVNTIIKKNNKLYGYNTDAQGFFECLDKKINQALVIGSGGAALAIIYILKKNAINLDIVNRSKKDNILGNRVFTYDKFNTNKKYDLIINATSAGLKDNDLPAPENILQSIYNENLMAIDIIYSKITPFLKFYQNLNIDTKDGLDMLINQGVLAFNIFFDNCFDKKILKNLMLDGLKQLKV